MAYVVTVNQPGYMPEQEPQKFATWTEARNACVDEACLTAGGDQVMHAELERQARQVWTGDAFTLTVDGWAHSVRRA